MNRKLPSPGHTGEYDVIVIGAGIHGAVAACRTAAAGLRTVLVERDDFGGGCSANSLKIIHGGLRYLQHLDFKRMRASIACRREYLRFAPHLVRPLPCLMPTYGHGLKGREIMNMALLVNDLISFDRNRGIGKNRRLPRGYGISAAECRDMVPGITRQGLLGGVVWHDALAENTERLVLEYIHEATRLGADCLNYCEIEKIIGDETMVQGVICRDRLTGTQVQLTAPMVVNTAGSWFQRLLPAGREKAVPPRAWARALNIVVEKPLFKGYAIALEGKEEHVDQDAVVKNGRRLLFFVPWRNNYTMIGTNYVAHSPEKPVFPVDRSEIESLLRDVNEIYPRAGLAFNDVTFYHAGLLPMSHGDEDPVQLLKSTTIVNHGGQGGLKGLYSVCAIKYTTAPHVADQLVKILFKEHGNGTPAISKWIPPAPHETRLQSPPTPLYAYLRQKYGNRASFVRPYLSADETRLTNRSSPLPGEIRYFIHEEMAVTLADVVFRRTGLGTARCPERDILKDVAQVMAAELDWSEKRIREEIQAVESRYAPLLHPGRKR